MRCPCPFLILQNARRRAIMKTLLNRQGDSLCYDYVWVDTEHACDYGCKDSMAYAKASVKGTARFIQVEHRETIENLDEIMKNEYIDGYVFGPCDLSGSYEVLGDVYGEKITAGADFDFIRDSAVRNCENIKRIHKGQ